MQESLLGVMPKEQKGPKVNFNSMEPKLPIKTTNGASMSKATTSFKSLPKIHTLEIKVAKGMYETRPTASYDENIGTQSAGIQHAWTTFTSLSDNQKNVMLKGLLHRCSTAQIDFICTVLNLKSVNDMVQSNMQHNCLLLMSLGYSIYTLPRLIQRSCEQDPTNRTKPRNRTFLSLEQKILEVLREPSCPNLRRQARLSQS
jgi:hypothetical protein